MKCFIKKNKYLIPIIITIILFASLYVYAADRNCYYCSGAGYVRKWQRCDICSGGGYVSCPHCLGSGQAKCSECAGKGGLAGVLCPNCDIKKSTKSCPKCNAYRPFVNPCEHCSATSSITCADCGGTGVIICTTCKGSGGASNKDLCPICRGTGTFR
ncbi:conserved hypothetical protein, secreted [Candidatus Omnitrophus magneticus]|uniref:CR-type domain-containing protein n=1 Tax=Candidatus Omnitrophus magneticus TaxID=1609969 RepID=A0A0F0CM52_9BACT|nr:conserved hypothetical protein, secreted [Candidatus Omnitrophus magneticus]